MVKITFGTACKIRFQQVLRRGQRVPCWLRVSHLCCWHSILVFMDRYVYVYIYIYIYIYIYLYHEASPKYWDF